MRWRIRWILRLLIWKEHYSYAPGIKFKKHGGADGKNGIKQFSELSQKSAPLVISYISIEIVKSTKKRPKFTIFQLFGIFLTPLMFLVDKYLKICIFFNSGYSELKFSPRETQPNRRSPHLVGSHLSPRLLLSAAAPTPCLFPVALFFIQKSNQ